MSHNDGRTHINRGRRLDKLIFSVAVSLLSISAGASLAQLVIERLETKEPAGIEDRISDLSQSLRTAAKAISEIEHEVEKRQDLVERLTRDAETAQRLAQLNKEEAEAIAQVLRSEIKQSESRGFWWGAGQNALFMLLGLGLGEALHRWRVSRFRSVEQSRDEIS